MSQAPVFHIDPKIFWQDPYPTLKIMRETCPVAYVPEFNAVLLTRYDDIFTNEKIIEVFSSDQPEGLMTKLMGENLMRKDGEAHMQERKAILPTISPRTVKQVWQHSFRKFTAEILDEITPLGKADMVKDIAMRISGEALKQITGLTNMTWQDMDRVSQGMIDGCANYVGNPDIEAHCHHCTADIDAYIDDMLPLVKATPNHSLLSVQLAAGMSEAQIRANIKLAISGGQNEPRDVIAGLVWALLNHPDQLALIASGQTTWLQAFEEYARWESPVGMSPREVAKDYELHGIKLTKGERVFFMFGSGNRDEAKFPQADIFDISRDCSASIAFGAGPHFCAGAWASRCLVAEVAMPMIFERLKGLHFDGATDIGGWAFRGPIRMPVAWDV